MLQPSVTESGVKYMGSGFESSMECVTLTSCWQLTQGSGPQSPHLYSGVNKSSHLMGAQESRELICAHCLPGSDHPVSHAVLHGTTAMNHSA